MKQTKLTETGVKRHLAIQRLASSPDARKTSTPLEIIGKVVKQDYTLAMANYNTTYCYPHSITLTTTLLLVYYQQYYLK